MYECSLEEVEIRVRQHILVEFPASILTEFFQPSQDYPPNNADDTTSVHLHVVPISNKSFSRNLYERFSFVLGIFKLDVRDQHISLVVQFDVSRRESHRHLVGFSNEVVERHIYSFGIFGIGIQNLTPGVFQPLCDSGLYGFPSISTVSPSLTMCPKASR